MAITAPIMPVMEAVIANHGYGSLLNQGESCAEAITAYITTVICLRHAITAPITAVIPPLGTQLIFFSKSNSPSAIYVLYLFDKLLYDAYNFS